MPSHRALAPDASQEQRLWHLGNETVDRAVGEAREEAEKEAGAELLKDAEVECNRIVKMLKVVGEILALYPPLPRSILRAESNAKGTLSIKHRWAYIEQRNYWRCLGCGTFCHKAKGDGEPTGGGPCRPGRSAERMVEAERLGHKLAAASIKGAPTIFCSKCGVHGTWQWRNLLAPCREWPRSYPEQNWLKDVLAGKEPAAKKPRTKAKDNKPKEKKRSKAKKTPTLPRTARPFNSLRNKTEATPEDRVRWAALGAGICIKAAAVPTTAALEAEASAGDDTAKEPEPVRLTPVVVRPSLTLLPPVPLDSDDEEVGCPNCAATVLATDESCQQCGAKRAERASPQCTLRVGELPNIAGPIWHGGTLTPPPFLAADFEPKPKRQRTEKAAPLTEAQKALIGANRERAKRRKANLRTTGKPSSTRKRPASSNELRPAKKARPAELPKTGSPAPTRPADTAKSAGSVRAPSAAELRLAGVVERVRAKERARALGSDG